MNEELYHGVRPRGFYKKPIDSRFFAGEIEDEPLLSSNRKSSVELS
ncbi:MAG: hypothetical protein LJE66_12845 [Desulfobacterales bacterium]|nr:hypothetical protein [Desulfobacterales bacterium]